MEIDPSTQCVKHKEKEQIKCLNKFTAFIDKVGLWFVPWGCGLARGKGMPPSDGLESNPWSPSPASD